MCAEAAGGELNRTPCNQQPANTSEPFRTVSFQPRMTLMSLDFRLPRRITSVPIAMRGIDLPAACEHFQSSRHSPSAEPFSHEDQPEFKANSATIVQQKRLVTRNVMDATFAAEILHEPPALFRP